MLTHKETINLHDLLSRERELVLLCLRECVHPGQHPLDSFRLLLDGLDWEAVARVAQNGKVLGFVVSVLQQRGLLNTLPLPVQALLMASLLRYERECALRKRQFADLSELLGRHSIRFVPLKGIALCNLVYADLPLRVMSDLDLLIKRDDREQVQALLQSAGFSRATRMYRNRWHDVIAEQAFGRMTLAGANFDLDIHYELNYLIGHELLSVNVQRAWQRVNKLSGDSAELWMLSPEDQLWHLFIHLVEGSAPALVQLLDVALVLKKYSIKADRLPTLGSDRITVAANLRLKAIAKLVDDLFFGSELNLSDESVKELKPFLIETTRPVSTINLHGTRDLLSLVPSWRNRLIYCLGFILPNQSYYEGSSMISAFIKHSSYRLSRATHWLLNKRDDQRTTAN